MNKLWTVARFPNGSWSYGGKPPLPIGTAIREGVIDSVCTYSAARYRVKENGCTQKGRFLLIRFEDAVAA